MSNIYIYKKLINKLKWGGRGGRGYVFGIWMTVLVIVFGMVFIFVVLVVVVVVIAVINHILG